MSSCGNTEKNIQTNNLPNREKAIETYKDGLKALETFDYFYAAKKFSEAEILLPQSEWAAKSALMTGYCFYQINFYTDAISNLQKIHKKTILLVKT